MTGNDEKTPLEIERKYLIRFPDLKRLEEKPNCEKIEIVQTYLQSKDDTEVRVRMRGKDGRYLFYRTEKRRITDTSRAEVERRITQEEYAVYLADADPLRRPVRKMRYCLTENSRYYEIDVFPEWKKQAILEVELRSENEEVVFPEEVQVIREVTSDRRYLNHALAVDMPEED